MSPDVNGKRGTLPMESCKVLGALGVWLLVAACGGETTSGVGGSGGSGAGSDAGVGGGTAAGGSGGSDSDGAGGSGGPRPPAAQGAASIHFNNPPGSALGAPKCPPGPHWLNAPVTADPVQQTTQFKLGTEAVDGERGNTVTCKVALVGGRFAVSGEISSAGTSPSGELTADIIVDVTIGAGESGVVGTLAISDDKTVQARYQSNACKFSVAPMNASGLSIAPGRVWAGVTCDLIADPLDLGGEACVVDSGFFVFENCTQ